MNEGKQDDEITQQNKQAAGEVSERYWSGLGKK